MLDHLNKDTILLEYGSGISTLKLSRHVKFLHSIEHDSKWFEKVRLAILNGQIKNVNIYYLPPEDKNDKYSYIDIDIQELNMEYGFKLFSSYINFADNIKFTDVFLDGRARVHCANKVYEKMDNNSYLFMHDFDRCYYKSILEKFKLVTLTDRLGILQIA